MSSKDLILVEKAYGATPLESILTLRHSGVLGLDEKATYAGRLDPLATGLLLILHGEGVHKKESYLGLEKTYEIELAFGVETDTGDVLGMPSVRAGEIPDLQEMIECLEVTREVQYPAYSSKTVKGKPLHEYTREGTEVSRPSRAVRYHVTQSAALAPLVSDDLKAQAHKACDLVHGDFRQELIKHAWSELALPQSIPRIAFTIEVSSGTYMRAIPEILKQHFAVAGVITRIHRTRVGEFELRNAIQL